jgi:PKHD-type hydroxylase
MYHFSKFDPDNNFSDYYQFYDPIDNNFIDMVFNLLQNFEYQDAFIGDSEIHQNQIRNSKLKFIELNDITKEIYNVLAGYIVKANKDFWNFNLLNSPENIQYTEYRSNTKSHYDWHQDYSSTTYRKLSIVLQLSDPSEYEGGDLEIWIPDPKTKKKDAVTTLSKQKGSIVVFPSYLWHRVTPVTKGIRKSLVWWVGGSPFR